MQGIGNPLILPQSSDEIIQTGFYVRKGMQSSEISPSRASFAAVSAAESPERNMELTQQLASFTVQADLTTTER